MNQEQVGPSRPLGELQEAVMHVVWERGDCSIRQVWEQLSQEREIAFNSVMTVMNRLVEQGLLQRSGSRGRYVYAAVHDRDSFERGLSRALSRGLIEDYGPAALAGFVEGLRDVDPRYLEELRRLVAESESAKEAD